MPKVIVTCEVQDGEKWEINFRTHTDLFRTYTLQAPMHFAISANEVTLCMEPGDLEAFRRSMDSPATVEAMELDGVKRETVKMLVLDKELKL